MLEPFPDSEPELHYSRFHSMQSLSRQFIGLSACLLLDVTWSSATCTDGRRAPVRDQVTDGGFHATRVARKKGVRGKSKETASHGQALHRFKVPLDEQPFLLRS